MASQVKISSCWTTHRKAGFASGARTGWLAHGPDHLASSRCPEIAHRRSYVHRRQCCIPRAESLASSASLSVSLTEEQQRQSQSQRTASTAGLVFGLGAPGSWDDAAVGSPVVRCYVGDDEQRWFMWHSGRRANSPVAGGGVDLLTPSSGSVGVAVSKDGIVWSRGSGAIEGARGAAASADVGAVIRPNGDWWTFDTCHLAPSDVQVLSNSSVSSGVGVYWMFYTGGDYEPVAPPEGLPGAPTATVDGTVTTTTVNGSTTAAGGDGEDGVRRVEGLRMRPGLAMSQDGRNWARIEGDHHSGALFDVGGAGQSDPLCVTSPQVLAVGPRDMRMYYTTWDTVTRRFKVLVATSPDGFKWTKKGVVFDPASAASSTAFDALGAAATCVTRDVDNRQYLMFYEAVGADNRRSIGLAVSKDGSVWRRYGSPVLTAAAAPGAEDAGSGGVDVWDGGDMGAPCAVSMSGGRWRLYYGGRRRSGPGPWEGIGLALSMEAGAKFEGVPVAFRRYTSKPEQTAAPGS